MSAEVTLALWQAAALLIGVVLVTALVTAAALRRTPREAAASRGVRSAPVPPQAVRPAADDCLPLAEGLIGAFDLATGSDAVRGHIRQVLRGAGVVPLDVEEGAHFDPAVHFALDTEPADADRSGRVARQLRPGWVRSGVVLRPAEVVVWSR